MHKSDHSNQRNRKLMTALSALVVACGLSTPVYSAPADNETGFRGAASQQTSSSGELADDSLLVLVKPGADTSAVQGYLSNEAHAHTVRHMHANTENYSILQVQPPAGQRENTLSYINSMKSSHGEIVSVGRNYLVHRLATFTPNDPDFSQQWPLTTQTWTGAYSQVVKGNLILQHNPSITILADGCDPVFANKELGFNMNQFNALDPNNIFLDNPPHGSFGTGGGEGDVDTSITSCRANNGSLIAGTSSFGINPFITMLQMTTGDSVSSANIYGAIIWSINHQVTRGGHGPVNLSYGTNFPNTPLWSDPVIQSLAGTLRNQGDILVVSCGDTPGTYSDQKFPMGNVLVVQGTDIHQQFFSHFLTQLNNDPLAAPGAPQPAVIGGTYHTDFFGTSFSAPFYASAIADCIAVNPNLSSLQAAHLVNSSGNQVFNAPYPAYVPNFWHAMGAAAR